MKELLLQMPSFPQRLLKHSNEDMILLEVFTPLAWFLIFVYLLLPDCFWNGLVTSLAVLVTMCVLYSKLSLT
jgi:hypothetical protein